MSKTLDIRKFTTENEEPEVPLKMVHANPAQDKHLEGFSEEEKKMIRKMAEIFVRSIFKLSK